MALVVKVIFHLHLFCVNALLKTLVLTEEYAEGSIKTISRHALILTNGGSYQWIANLNLREIVVKKIKCQKRTPLIALIAENN
jgi:hypothetical protein